MPQAYVELTEGVTLDPPAGGRIRSGGNVYPAGALYGTRYGASFGPLLIEVPDEGQLEVADLSFLPGEGDGGLFVFGSAAVAAGPAAASATEPDGEDIHDAREAVHEANSPTTRRAVMALGLAALGAALTGSASATDEDGEELVTLEIAEFDIQYSDTPFTLALVDAVEHVLPPTTEVLVDVGGTRVGNVADTNEPVVIREAAEDVTVYLRDSRGRITRLLAWAASFASLDDSLTYRRTFPNGTQASDYDANEFVRLTEHPAIVRPVTESGPDATTLTIGQTTIPHADEDANGEAGAWDIVGGALIYEAGPNPPVADEWTLTTRLGPVQRLLA